LDQKGSTSHVGGVKIPYHLESWIEEKKKNIKQQQRRRADQLQVGWGMETKWEWTLRWGPRRGEKKEKGAGGQKDPKKFFGKTISSKKGRRQSCSERMPPVPQERNNFHSTLSRGRDLLYRGRTPSVSHEGKKDSSQFLFRERVLSRGKGRGIIGRRGKKRSSHDRQTEHTRI